MKSIIVRVSRQEKRVECIIRRIYSWEITHLLPICLGSREVGGVTRIDTYHVRNGRRSFEYSKQAEGFGCTQFNRSRQYMGRSKVNRINLPVPSCEYVSARTGQVATASMVA